MVSGATGSQTIPRPLGKLGKDTRPASWGRDSPSFNFCHQDKTQAFPQPMFAHGPASPPVSPLPHATALPARAFARAVLAPKSPAPSREAFHSAQLCDWLLPHHHFITHYNVKT